VRYSDEWGYGIESKPQEAYEYADGKYVYFTSDDEYKELGLEVVYFSEGDVIFQFLDKEKQTREDVRQF